MYLNMESIEVAIGNSNAAVPNYPTWRMGMEGVIKMESDDVKRCDGGHGINGEWCVIANR